MTSERIKCSEKGCDSKILQSTATQTGGMCMPCFKVSKGRSYLTKESRTKTDSSENADVIPVFIMNKRVFSGISETYLHTNLTDIATTMDGAFSEEMITRIVERYKTIEGGQRKP